MDLVNPTRVQLLTPGRPFGEPPEIVSSSSPRFQWSADEELLTGASYRIQVVSVDGAASAEEALQGFAAWDAAVSGTTALYPGSVSAIPLVAGATYAWQVTREVTTSGGSQTLTSPIYAFRMANASGGASSAGNQSAGDLGANVQLDALAQALGFDSQLAGFKPTGQIIVDGRPLSVANLEALLRCTS